MPSVSKRSSSAQRVARRAVTTYRVRGLLGHAALADWLEDWFDAEFAITVRASAASGSIRIPGDSAAANGKAIKLIGRALAEFDPCERHVGKVAVAREEPRRPGPAARRPARKADRPVAAREPRRTGARHRTGRVGTAGPACADAYAREAAEIFRALGTDAAGLSVAEATRRLERDGPNRIADVVGRSDLDILLAQFKSVPVALLGASGLASFLMRAYMDAAAIATVVTANGAIGFLTERHAERTVSSLRKLAPGTATVIRDGKTRSISAEQVVVGDVLLLKPGQSVAADARVIEAHRLSVNEAPLTGESLPMRKSPENGLAPQTALAERHNMVHLGTIVSGGVGRGVVTAVGDATELGGIRALAETAEKRQSRLQSELDGLSARLAYGSVALCGGIVLAGLLRGRAAGPLLRTTVALGVAAIPEGLPTVATSLLSSGIRSMRERRIYARSLDAIENLGAVDVVCLDKTGTLTENRMRVASVVIGDHIYLREQRRASRPRPALSLEGRLVCALCNEVERADEAWQGSPTELALLRLSAEQGTDLDAVRRDWPRLAIKHRSEHHPYMVTLHRAAKGGNLVAVKGRPAEVLARCTRWHDGTAVRTLNDAVRKKLQRRNADLAAAGHRVLALASRRQKKRGLSETGGLTWLGMVGLADPIREGIDQTIQRFRKAGIQPKMITGDQVGTASAVATQIGLGDAGSVVDGSKLPERAAEIVEPAENAVAFARATPALKLELVRALQRGGHVVAMTGDGINDGPALKVADVGVAMGATGTDFAQAMSDLVLQGDHPADLLEAIAEGRTAYLNVKKAVQYLVGTNLSELAVTGICAALGLPDPLDPLALLWTNLVTDVSPAIALGLEPPEPDILERPPFRRADGMLDRDDWRRMVIDGGLMTAVTMGSFLYGLGRYGAGPQARTVAFMTLTSSQLLYALTARSEGRISDPLLRSNKLLNRVTAVSLAMQAGTSLFPPLRAVLRTSRLSPGDWVIVSGAAALPALLRELSKPAATRRGGVAKGGRK